MSRKTDKAAEAAQQQPETDYHQVLKDCEHAGKGGSYVVKDGKRVLEQRTRTQAEHDAQANK